MVKGSNERGGSHGKSEEKSSNSKPEQEEEEENSNVTIVGRKGHFAKDCSLRKK